jgi:hypothetical protein
VAVETDNGIDLCVTVILKRTGPGNHVGVLTANVGVSGCHVQEFQRDENEQSLLLPAGTSSTHILRFPLTPSVLLLLVWFWFVIVGLAVRRRVTGRALPRGGAVWLAAALATLPPLAVRLARNNVW